MTPDTEVRFSSVPFGRRDEGEIQLIKAGAPWDGTNVAVPGGVSQSKVKDRPLDALLRNLDGLLEEARRLSEEIRGALDRPAFWPDRRHSNIPHQPERRHPGTS